LQFGSAGLSEDRLRVASAIYGLSPAQQRLASLVAEGKSLNEIAAEMKITANTARTISIASLRKLACELKPLLSAYYSRRPRRCDGPHSEDTHGSPFQLTELAR
jgi:DNA-binding CsgD family transcriptional regulator